MQYIDRMWNMPGSTVFNPIPAGITPGLPEFSPGVTAEGFCLAIDLYLDNYIVESEMWRRIGIVR